MIAENKTIKYLKKGIKYLFLIVMSVIVVFPFYIMLIESLHPNLVSFPYPVEFFPKVVSADNYGYLFSYYPVMKWILNNILDSLP